MSDTVGSEMIKFLEAMRAQQEFKPSKDSIFDGINKNGFGFRLMLAINRSQLPCKDVAAGIGVTAAILRTYLNDIVKPSFDRLISISKLLNVSVDYLLSLSESMDISK
jgi:hypothetical protein